MLSIICVDLKDAFHSLSFTDKAKEFCGILPYFGSPHYRYEVLPMGLAISPQVWITYIENLLEGVPSKQSYIAIMMIFCYMDSNQIIRCSLKIYL